MNKQKFVDFLNKKAEERQYMTHWKKVYSNSDDFYQLHKPAVDWLEDSMDLRVEGVVKISYNQSLYDNESTKIFETTYDDFVTNYDKTISK